MRGSVVLPTRSGTQRRQDQRNRRYFLKHFRIGQRVASPCCPTFSVIDSCRLWHGASTRVTREDANPSRRSELEKSGCRKFGLHVDWATVPKRLPLDTLLSSPQSLQNF